MGSVASNLIPREPATLLLQRLCERLLQAHQSALYKRSVTHCQQAVEKSIKAVLACMGRMEPSHYLSALLRSLLVSIRDVV